MPAIELDATSIVVAAITAVGVIAGAYFALRGVLKNARVQQTEAETAQTKVAIDSAFTLAEKWKDYSGELEGRFDKVEKQLKSIKAEQDDDRKRIETLEVTVNVSATHIAQVHDWADREGYAQIPPIPAVIYPLVSPLRRIGRQANQPNVQEARFEDLN